MNTNIPMRCLVSEQRKTGKIREKPMTSIHPVTIISKYIVNSFPNIAVAIHDPVLSETTAFCP